MSIIFYTILVYLLYRFITGFILPVFKATSQVKKQFNAMHQQAEAQQANNYDQQNRSTQNGFNQKPKYDVEGEYIKFEEIKD